MTLDLRQRNVADKAAGQFRGDVGLCVDGLTTIMDTAVGDATAPSYHQPPPDATAASEVAQQVDPAPRGGR